MRPAKPMTNRLWTPSSTACTMLDHAVAAFPTRHRLGSPEVVSMDRPGFIRLKFLAGWPFIRCFLANE
jgi:hypothetical protein